MSSDSAASVPGSGRSCGNTSRVGRSSTVQPILTPFHGPNPPRGGEFLSPHCSCDQCVCLFGKWSAAYVLGPSQSLDSESPGPPAPTRMLGPQQGAQMTGARMDDEGANFSSCIYHKLEGGLRPDAPNPDCLPLGLKGVLAITTPQPQQGGQS